MKHIDQLTQLLRKQISNYEKEKRKLERDQLRQLESAVTESVRRQSDPSSPTPQDGRRRRGSQDITDEAVDEQRRRRGNLTSTEFSRIMDEVQGPLTEEDANVEVMTIDQKFNLILRNQRILSAGYIDLKKDLTHGIKVKT